MATRTAQYDLFKDEYLSLDGTETINVVPTGGESPIEGATGKRSNTDKRRGGGQPAFVEINTIVWIVFDNTLGGVAMQERFRIEDESGNGYSINSCRQERFGTQWRCECTPDRK